MEKVLLLLLNLTLLVSINMQAAGPYVNPRGLRARGRRGPGLVKPKRVVKPNKATKDDVDKIIDEFVMIDETKDVPEITKVIEEVEKPGFWEKAKAKQRQLVEKIKKHKGKIGAGLTALGALIALGIYANELEKQRGTRRIISVDPDEGVTDYIIPSTIIEQERIDSSGKGPKEIISVSSQGIEVEAIQEKEVPFLVPLSEEYEMNQGTQQEKAEEAFESLPGLTEEFQSEAERLGRVAGE